MESAFRSQDVNVYLIAIEKELAVTYTNMDLQGNLDKKFTINWRFSDKPARPREAEVWPATPEENLERLADAGAPVDRGVPKWSVSLFHLQWLFADLSSGNCNELGHSSKHCPQDKVENADRAVLLCYNCEQTGHRESINVRKLEELHLTN